MTLFVEMSDLKLVLGEGARVVTVLIPESVSLPQIEKLLAENAGKRGTWNRNSAIQYD